MTKALRAINRPHVVVGQGRARRKIARRFSLSATNKSNAGVKRKAAICISVLQGPQRVSCSGVDRYRAGVTDVEIPTRAARGTQKRSTGCRRVELAVWRRKCALRMNNPESPAPKVKLILARHLVHPFAGEWMPCVLSF